MAAYGALITVTLGISLLNGEPIKTSFAVQGAVGALMFLAGFPYVVLDAMALFRGGVPSYQGKWLTKGHYWWLASAVVFSAIFMPLMGVMLHRTFVPHRLSYFCFETLFGVAFFCSSISSGILAAAFWDAHKKIRRDGFAPKEAKNETA